MTPQEAQRPAPRLPELSAGNLAFCGMVLLLHLCSDTIMQAPTGTVFYGLVFTLWQLSAVAVYGFLFLSGLKAQLGRPRPLKEYYARRARAILPGYLLWSAVYLALRAVLGGGLAPGRMAVELLTGGAAAHLYFVFALVQFYALAPLWRAMTRRLSPAVVLPVLALAAPVLSDGLASLWQWLPGDFPVQPDRLCLRYLLVWCAGSYAGADYARFTDALRRGRWFLGGAFALVAPVYLWCMYRARVDLVWYPFLTALEQLYLGVAVGAAMAAAQALGPRLMRSRALQALDRASYQIYLGHMLPLLLAPGLLRRLGVPDLAAVQLLGRAVIVLVPTLGLSLLWQGRKKKNEPLHR